LDYIVSRVLDLAVAATPNRIAATLGDDAITYLQCERAAARLAQVLVNWGVRKGDRILYWSSISLRDLDIFFACSHVGAIFVPANPAYSQAEFDAVADYIEPAFVVAGPSHMERAAIAAKRVNAKFGVLGSRGSVPGLDFDTAMTKSVEQRPARSANGADECVMFLTSGSTGKPKAVVISHRAQYNRSCSSPSYDLACGGGGVVSMFPLFHMAGWHMVLQAFSRRRTVHLTRQANADQLWNIVEQHRPFEFYGIPAVWRRVLENSTKRDGSSLGSVLTGTSRVELDLLEELRARFPDARNGIFYGSTEMGVCMGIGHDDILTHPYSVGTPMPGLEARIDDGELLLRGDTIMEGYFRLPDETNEAIADNWYRTGDLVSVDADGFYEIVGRRREIIRSGGESIAPVEVEAAIAGFPGIREVAVVGLPHDSWGEMVCAVVVLEANAQAPTVEALRSHIKDSLAAFKHPRMVHTWSTSLPRTGATGQIQRRKVQQEIIAAQNRE
jgi:acyl-CoA synthetase (AMP-forming)/AMP-acid ligase II